MPVDYGAILGAVAQYFAGRGSSGDTPNTYEIPQSAAEKRWDDERWRVYTEGGSPQSRATAGVARQVLGQLPTTANPQFASPMMRDQPFAGGVKLPSIDFSKLPDFSKPPTTTTQPSGGFGDGPQRPGPGARDERRDARNNPNENPINPRGGGGPFGIDPYGTDRLPTSTEMGFKPQTPGEFAGAVGDIPEQFSEWWTKYKAEHPDWQARGVQFAANVLGGFFSLPLGAAYSWLRKMVGRDAAAGTPTTPTSKMDDFYNSPPGTANDSPAYGTTPPGLAPQPPGTGNALGAPPASGYGVTAGTNNAFAGFGQPGSVAPPPPQLPPGYRLNPRNGQVETTGGRPLSESEQRWINEWWEKLKAPPGSNSGSDTSESSGTMPWDAWRR